MYNTNNELKLLIVWVLYWLKIELSSEALENNHEDKLLRLEYSQKDTNSNLHNLIK